MKTTKPYFYSLAEQILREERIQLSWVERAEHALSLWEIRSKFAEPRNREIGDGSAANLRGTPDKGCPRAQVLCADLEWRLSKIPA